jgi:PilZ domain
VAESSGAERRRAPRAEVDEALTFIVDSDASQLTRGAFFIDLSQLGARVRAQVRLQPGQLITLIPGGAGPGVKSRVIWISDEGEGCEAGIAFLEPVSLIGSKTKSRGTKKESKI